MYYNSNGERSDEKKGCDRKNKRRGNKRDGITRKRK